MLLCPLESDPKLDDFAGGVDEGTNRLWAKLRGCGRGEWKRRGGSGRRLREGRAAAGGQPAGEGVRPLLRAPSARAPCPVLQAGGSSSARAYAARRAVAAGSVRRRAGAAGSARGGYADGGSSSSFGRRQSRDEGDKHTPSAALAPCAGRIWRQRAATRRTDLGPAAGERQQRRARTRWGSAGGGALWRRRPFPCPLDGPIRRPIFFG